MLQDTNISTQAINIEPMKLVDEHSPIEFYIGTSINGSDKSKPIWKINKVKKLDSVWELSKYPNGNQNFVFVWDLRLTYEYM